MQPHELRALQKLWDLKLQQSGFQDAEESNRLYLKSWHSTYFLRYPQEVLGHREVYYEIAYRFLWAYEGFQKAKEEFPVSPKSRRVYVSKLPSPYARAIWELHCEGLSRRQIARALKERQVVRLSADSVQKIVSELQSIMKRYEWLKDEQKKEEANREIQANQLPFLRQREGSSVCL